MLSASGKLVSFAMTISVAVFAGSSRSFTFEVGEDLAIRFMRVGRKSNPAMRTFVIYESHALCPI